MAFHRNTIAQNLADYNDHTDNPAAGREVRFSRLERRMQTVMYTARRALERGDTATYERMRIAAKDLSRQMDALVAEEREELEQAEQAGQEEAGADASAPASFNTPVPGGDTTPARYGSGQTSARPDSQSGSRCYRHAPAGAL